MITKLEIINGSIPLTRTEPLQSWVEEWSNQLYVIIENDHGLQGIGEILPAAGNTRTPYAALVERLKGYVTERDESNIREMWSILRRLTFSGGYGITTGAISGIDIALWDLLSRSANLELSKILGKKNRAVSRYASLSRYPSTEDVVKVVENLLIEGYRSIKLHQTKTDTLEAVRAVRSTLGFDFTLMVDLNCSMGFNSAMNFMLESNKFELKWVEEPIWPPDDFDSLKKLNKVGPVAAGENFFSIFDFRRLLENDCLTYYQPDVAKIGGVTPLIDILGLMKSYNAFVAFHNRPHNGWISTIASSHLAASYDGPALVETPPNEIPEHFIFSGRINKNEVEVGGPGLGIQFNGEVPQSEESKMLRFH